ncbi:MAG: Uncharacterised protein [Flavobacteriaceae bacterium]|nr:MAG: Uncharacterised protein [Flavobacteriaceae bacterium]
MKIKSKQKIFEIKWLQHHPESKTASLITLILTTLSHTLVIVANSNKTEFVQKKAIYYNDDSMSAKFHCFRKKILKIIKTKKACYMNDVSAKNERNLYILYNFLWNVNIIFRL